MNKIFLSIGVIITVILLLHFVTPLEITNFWVLIILIFLFFFATVRFVTGFLIKKINLLHYFIMLLLSSTLLYFIVRNNINTLEGWRTTMIYYQNTHSKNRTVERQLLDKGYGEFEERTIDKTKILPFVTWIKPANQASYDPRNWERVNMAIKTQ